MGNVLKVEFEESYLIGETLNVLLTNYEAELKANNFKKIIDDVLDKALKFFSWDYISSKFYLNVAYTLIEFMSEENIPWPYETIPRKLFSDCYDLIKVEIPNSVRKIDEYTFNHCEKLNSITIPESVTIIGADAFEGCYDKLIIYTKNNYAISYCKTYNIKYELI